MMTMRDFVLPALAQMLDALSGQLDKAQQYCKNEEIPFEEILSARLAPDMFPLASQIQFACTQAEETNARWRGDAPRSLDAPATFADAKALIASTGQRLRSTAAEDGVIDEQSPIELQLPNGMIFDLSLYEYLRSWSLPQFYFHLVTAYAIMRNCGVELGKADYVPHMVAFLRTGER
jgi:hypothetical protein